MKKTQKIFLTCPRCNEYAGVAEVKRITDKFENLYIAFESEIDQLNPDELFELCQYLHKEDFICKKCEYVYTYDEYLANEADKYSKLEWTVIYDKNKSEK